MRNPCSSGSRNVVFGNGTDKGLQSSVQRNFSDGLAWCSLVSLQMSKMDGIICWRKMIEQPHEALAGQYS